MPDKSNHGKDRENGDEEHWDVQGKDGKGYVNVGKNGKRWGGKKPNLPQKNSLNIWDAAGDIVIGVAVGYGIWQFGKWAIAALAAIPTSGGSLVLAAVTP